MTARSRCVKHIRPFRWLWCLTRRSGEREAGASTIARWAFSPNPPSNEVMQKAVAVVLAGGVYQPPES